jgi:hypothetical protein
MNLLLGTNYSHTFSKSSTMNQTFLVMLILQHEKFNILYVFKIPQTNFEP